MKQFSTWPELYRHAEELALRVRELEEVLRLIAYEMPTTERNPDGDEQAAHSMQLVARDALEQ